MKKVSLLVLLILSATFIRSQDDKSLYVKHMEDLKSVQEYANQERIRKSSAERRKKEIEDSLVFDRYNKFVEYQKRRKISDSLEITEKEASKRAEQRRNDSVYNVKYTFYKSSKFPFDTTVIIEYLNRSADSLFKIGQTIKADKRIERADLLTNKIKRPGRIYIFNVVNENEWFSLDSYQRRVRFLDYELTFVRKKDHWEVLNSYTSDEILDKLQSAPSGVRLSLKILLLPGENKCKILSVISK